MKQFRDWNSRGCRSGPNVLNFYTSFFPVLPSASSSRLPVPSTVTLIRGNVGTLGSRAMSELRRIEMSCGARVCIFAEGNRPLRPTYPTLTNTNPNRCLITEEERLSRVPLRTLALCLSSLSSPFVDMPPSGSPPPGPPPLSSALVTLRPALLRPVLLHLALHLAVLHLTFLPVTSRGCAALSY